MDLKLLQEVLLTVVMDNNQKGISRRELLKATGLVGVGAALGGGLIGYLAGKGSGLGEAGQSAATSAGSAAGAAATSKRVDKIRIGSSFPLTGWASGDGEEMRRGLIMAVEEINARGGVGGFPLETVILDAEDMSPEKTLANFQRLVEKEKVHAIICGFHIGTGPEVEYLTQHGIPYLNVNTIEAQAKKVRENRKKYYMIFQSDPTEIWYASGFAVYMDHLIETGAWKPYNRKVAVVTGDVPYSLTIADVFRTEVEKRGWEISLYEKVVMPVAEWGPTLSKIRKNPPGLIFITDYAPSDLASFMKQFVANPTPSLVYQQYGPSIPEYLDLAGDAANGVIWSTVIGILPDEMGNKFREKYRKRWNSEPGSANAGSLWDQVHLYSRAVAMVGDPTNYKKVCDEIARTIHRGVTGTMSYNDSDLSGMPYPDMVKDPSLGMPHPTFQIQGKKHVLVSPDPYTQGKFQLPPWLKA